MVQRKIRQAIGGLLLSSFLWADTPYDIKKSYPSGSQVIQNGYLYEAKWWANPGQSPAGNYQHDWETPWKMLKKAASRPEAEKPPATAIPASLPPSSSSPSIPDSDNAYPDYAVGTPYKGGDIVRNKGKLYQCKPGITAAWCGGAAWAYAPGTGTAWSQAWSLLTEKERPSSLPSVSTTINQATSRSGSNNPTPTSSHPIPPTNSINRSAQTMDQREEELTGFSRMQKIKASIATLDNNLVNAIYPGAHTNPENVRRVEGIISSSSWDYLFPKRTSEYTYRHFLQAIGKFPAFCAIYKDGRDSDRICRRSLSTLFSHFTQETGGYNKQDNVPLWRQGLVHVREMGWSEDMKGGYNSECNPTVWQGQTWPCGTFPDGEFKSYFGRGAKQLSYNYNYGPFSDAVFGTPRTLLDNPEKVADTWLNIASAIFFFIYPQPPKPSMLHVIDGTWKPNNRDRSNGLTPGFGVTTQIINGGMECGGPTEMAQSQNRIDYYQNFALFLGVDIPHSEKLGCANMKQFDSEGAGAVNIYWEKDWSWSGETPDGKSYACKLVSYQTPYSALKKGDFTRCAQHHFPNIVITQ
ncbi:Chitin-binding protein CbpD [invertebrate metagenome]|uniref:Chitin-binding protein CbpD n=1 Tax=invertebrate metagenome TaxID=1711999 RepID=A0A2H9TA42_9ZZZZ